MARAISFRRFWNRVHLYLGLASAVPVLVLCVTGVPLVFEEELLRFENRAVTRVTPEGKPHSLERAVAVGLAVYPEETPLYVRLPRVSTDAVIIGTLAGSWVGVDQYRLRVLGRRPPGEGWMPLVRALHQRFAAGEVVRPLVTVSTAVFVISLITGLYLWWKRPKSLKDRFRFDLGRSGARFQYELHLAVGVYASVALLLIAISGILIGMRSWWAEGVQWITNSEFRAAPRVDLESLDPDGGRLPLDAFVRIADAAAPETIATQINFSRTPEQPVSVRRRFTWGERPEYIVYIHPQSGAVLGNYNPFEFEIGHTVHRLNRGLHSGHIGTEGMKWAWAIASVLPLILIYTGVVFWWGPVSRRRRRRRLERAHAESMHADGLNRVTFPDNRTRVDAVAEPAARGAMGSSIVSAANPLPPSFDSSSVINSTE